MRSLPLSRLLLSLALAAAAPAQLRIACLGDSITFGARIADREHSCYPAQLAAMRPQDEVRNFGVGGATLLLRADRPLLSTRAFRDALAWRPDVAVVMLGTNDSCDTERRPNWSHQGDLERDARALVERLRRANPACRVVLATPPAMFPDQPGLDDARRADLRARSPRLRRGRRGPPQPVRRRAHRAEGGRALALSTP
jgi:lysophospholipase L1-like esterase